MPYSFYAQWKNFKDCIVMLIRLINFSSINFPKWVCNWNFKRRYFKLFDVISTKMEALISSLL